MVCAVFPNCIAMYSNAVLAARAGNVSLVFGGISYLSLAAGGVIIEIPKCGVLILGLKAVSSRNET